MYHNILCDPAQLAEEGTLFRRGHFQPENTGLNVIVVLQGNGLPHQGQSPSDTAKIE